jgi:hypothetical protein
MVTAYETPLRLNVGEDWEVRVDTRGGTEPSRFDARGVPLARLRRIGWIDQKGRMYLEVPSGARFDGGSLSPLLIDPGERDQPAGDPEEE